MFGNIIKSADLLMKWRNSEREKDQYIYEYVLKIAEDADHLALIWTDILSELIDKNSVKIKENPLILSFVERPRGWERSNVAVFTRLEHFYNRLHYVFGDYDKKKADFLLDKLAMLMHTRNLTRVELQKAVGVDELNKDRIAALIEQVNKQASEIRGFALELKARQR